MVHQMYSYLASALYHPPFSLSLSPSVALQPKLCPGHLILRFLNHIHLSPSVPKAILVHRYSTETKHFCKNIVPTRSTDVTLVNIEITVLWDVMPWSMVSGFKHFSGMPSTPGTSVLTVDAACPSETLEPSYQTHSVTSLKIAIPMMTFTPCCTLTPDLSCSNMKATHTQNKKLISEQLPANKEVLWITFWCVEILPLVLLLAALLLFSGIMGLIMDAALLLWLLFGTKLVFSLFSVIVREHRWSSIRLDWKRDNKSKKDSSSSKCSPWDKHFS